MGQSAPTWTVSISAGLAVAPAVGLPAANFVPSSLYAAVATSVARTKPPNVPAWYDNQAQISVIARGMITWHTTPGDCGSPGQVDFSAGSEVGGALSIGAGIASMAGIALPGVGQAIGLITSFINHHPEAVALEQNVSCAVALVFNQIIAHYDQQVRSGAIAPATAIAGVAGFCAQAKGQLSQIAHAKNAQGYCDWGCELQGIAAAHADFLTTYYPAIAPQSIFSNAPGAAPSFLGTVPGNIQQVGAAVSSGFSQITAGLSNTEKFFLIALVLAVSGFAAYRVTR